jgi:hypothetical protein
MKIPAAWIKATAYPQLVEAKGWQAQPWDGRNGVGVHLGRLTGGRTFGWLEVDGERKRARGYSIPLVIALDARRRA